MGGPRFVIVAGLLVLLALVLLTIMRRGRK